MKKEKTKNWLAKLLRIRYRPSVFKDKKKEASRKACREKVKEGE